MIDKSITINLNANLQDLITNNKKQDLNIENKVDFKEYLYKNKKFTNEYKEDEKDIKLNENEGKIKNLYSEISEKIEKKLNNEDSEVGFNEEDLEEILSLLLNLMNTNLKEIDENNEFNLNNSNSDNNILMNLIKENNDELLKNIKSLLEKYSKEEDTDSESSLINNMLEEVINKLEYDETENSDKYKIDSNNDKKENILKVNLLENSEEINEENSYEKKKGFNENTINEKEEEVLMKFLADDSNESFSKTLNYYNNLNKTNSIGAEEVINKPIEITKENINLDIIKNIKYMISNSVEELKVKIYPKELGEMTIKILSEEGIMKAEIKATSKETYNLLNSNINEIKKTLENQNIKIQEVNIGIYNEDTTFFSGRESSKDNLKEFNKKSRENLIYDEEEYLENLIIDNNVNLLA